MQAAGDAADLADLVGYDWSGMELTENGSCFIVSDEDAPDPTKSWFYCDDPDFEEEAMVCELVPEWMGKAPNGGHAVWLCSAPKPVDE